MDVTAWERLLRFLWLENEASCAQPGSSLKRLLTVTHKNKQQYRSGLFVG